nr:redoxin domain-containing protein [Chloroflexota bacterium]
MAQLCRHVAELAALNTKVVVVSFGSSPLGRAWLDETREPFTLWLDPERAAYRAYGLEHSLLRSWAPRVWRRYAQLMLTGRKWRGIQGDSGQLGGDFIVDRNGVIHLAYRSHDPTGRPPVSRVLDTLRRLNGASR